MATKKTSTEYPKKLPKKFKAKWLEALRSGEYKQGTGQLYRVEDDSYCCLGVACRIASINKESIAGFTTINKSYFKEAEKIPKALLCRNDNTTNPIVDKLIGMNDGIFTKKRNFEEIADFIEKNY